jgi:hypothetical protein
VCEWRRPDRGPRRSFPLSDRPSTIRAGRSCGTAAPEELGPVGLEFEIADRFALDDRQMGGPHAFLPCSRCLRPASSAPLPGSRSVCMNSFEKIGMGDVGDCGASESSA